MTKQRYIKRVGRALECAPAKKREILRQLDSDIGIALGEGRELRQILEEMGTPRALAGEFNESLDREERRRARRRKWGLRIVCILGALLAVLAVAAGTVYWMLPKERNIEDSKVFDTAQVQSRAEAVIALFSAEEYETLEGYASEELREALARTSFSVIRGYIGEDWGELQSIGRIYMVEIRERNKAYAAVQVNVSYENVNVTFTLSFNRQMELYGFYVR